MKRHWLCAGLLALHVVAATPLVADIHDPLDPFDSLPGLDESEDDSQKTADELINEGGLLLDQERPLDARTKLLKALQRDPKAYRAHILLAGYYTVHVGHFRLALKYIKQAQSIFEEKHGLPPYKDMRVQLEHGQILYLLSQIRLDLDNYQGSLETLDEYEHLGYYAPWYMGARAWVLMKLGRIEDAIKVARLGVLAGAEPGRTLNMLGILLSMHGEREASIQVFKDAIAYEYALGEQGQPATPLNNSGEVYKELFEDDKAEAAWLKATSLKDGCEHVLPSLNLALLYLDQLNLSGAKRTMDAFESCVAQYPLRNGEEHKALVHLARGRIDMHAGKIDDAIGHFEEALERRQWFGKIGTSQEDLQAAALTSLAQALDRKVELDEHRSYDSFIDRLRGAGERAAERLRSWWTYRRARQVFVDELKGIEDLAIRNTDSLVEYPTFGSLLSTFPRRVFDARLEQELKDDDREKAKPYYDGYKAETYLAAGRVAEAQGLLTKALESARPRYDDLLRVHLFCLLLKTFDERSTQYSAVASQTFALSGPALRSYGLRLPVNYKGEYRDAVDALGETSFLPDNERPLTNSVVIEKASDAQGAVTYTLQFVSSSGVRRNIKVTGSDLAETVNRLADEVFTIEVK